VTPIDATYNLLQDPEAKPDYRAQTLKEINKVEAKVILLNEMLDNVDTSRGEQFVAGDVYDVSPALLQSQFLTGNWAS
jgi:ADP-ribosylation factor-binding protein GGA